MPIDTPSRDYNTFAPKWQRLRDVVAGEDAIKAKDKTYLKKPGGMLDDDYPAYLLRAQFYNATGRTVSGLAGSITRKPAQVELPEALRESLDSLTLAGDSLEELVREGVGELLTVGRLSCLVDMAADGQGLPYLQLYRAEETLDVRTAIHEGRERIVLVRLKECYEETDPKDEWTSSEKHQIRLLRLNKEGIYEVSLWRKKENAEGKVEWMQEGQTIVPKFRGEPLTEIPFVTVGAASPRPRIQKPPLDDLATANLAHYRCDADIKWGLFYTAMPIPVVKGFRGKPASEGGKPPELAIGPSVVLPLDPDGDFYFGEVNGAGLATYREERRDIEKQMVHLGAMLLRDQKKEAETAETMRLAQSADAASLFTIVGSWEYGLECCLRWWAEWQGYVDAEIHLKLNRDFFDSSIPYTLADLTQAWRDGSLSDEALVFLLSRGELLPPGTTPEDYLLTLRANKETNHATDTQDPGTQDPGQPADPEDPNEPADPPEQPAKPGPVRPARAGRAATPKPRPTPPRGAPQRTGARP